MGLAQLLRLLPQTDLGFFGCHGCRVKFSVLGFVASQGVVDTTAVYETVFVGAHDVFFGPVVEGGSDLA